MGLGSMRYLVCFPWKCPRNLLADFLGLSREISRETSLDLSQETSGDLSLEIPWSFVVLVTSNTKGVTP